MKSPGATMYLLQIWFACSYLIPFLIAQDVLLDRSQPHCIAEVPQVLPSPPQPVYDRDEDEDQNEEEYPVADSLEDNYQEENLDQILSSLPIGKTVNIYATTTVTCAHMNYINITINCGNCWKLVYKNSDLRVIPTNMDQGAQQLTGIKLTKSKIQKIEPGAFSNLPNLLVLELENNNLTKISRGIFNSLPELEFLNLSHNSIAEIEEDCFHGSSNIEILDLSFNKIITIPENIFQHQRLKTLNISNNLLANFDGQKIPELKTVILDNNHLEKFPSFSGSSITHLSIKFNFITSFNVTDLPTSLEMFLIGNNRIHHLDQYSFNLASSLRILDMSNNFLGEFNPEILINLDELEILDISGNDMKTINTKLFIILKSLRSINLGKNNITTLPKGVFQHLSNLINLEFSENNITYIQQGVLKDLVSLQTLNFSRNKIKYLQAGIFSGLKKLEVLDLSSNNLESFSFHVLSALEKLRVLDVSYNRLTSLIVNLRRTRGALIALDGNNFTCTNLAKTINVLRSEYIGVLRGKTLSSENIDGISCSEKNENANTEDNMTDMKYFFERGFKNTSFYNFFKDFRRSDWTEPNVNNVLDYLRDNLTVDFSKSMKNHVKDFINFQNASFREFFQQMEDIRKHNESTSLEGLSSVLQKEIESFVTFENSSFQNYLDKMSQIVDSMRNDRNRSEDIPKIIERLQNFKSEKLVSSRETENNTELIEAINQLKIFLILCSFAIVLLVLGVKLFPVARKRYSSRNFQESNTEIPMLS
ncbi:toll-like receptor 7 [Harmonia axyridis]|uniref:toll-like receptor 7 n=1 Tax=Harmonia axyridis TaxID=115357 RepID=UPI001E277628|nr:toll-like receptor 7 [Harmonia axyridis]